MDTSAPISLASAIRRWLKIRDGETLLHYMCGDGKLVEAFQSLGIRAFGCLPNDKCPEEYYIQSEIPLHSYSHIVTLERPPDPIVQDLVARCWATFSMMESTWDGATASLKLLASFAPTSTVSASFNCLGSHANGSLYITCRRNS